MSVAGGFAAAREGARAHPSRSTVETVLYSFQGGLDGDRPGPDLIADANGALYGTTQGGGTYGLGTVFKLTPSGSGYTESVLHSFDGTDGRYPQAGVIADASGTLYTTVAFGGPNPCGCGVVIALTPSGNSYEEKILYAFLNRGDGAEPRGGLVRDASGALYGTTVGFEPAFGTVFKLTPSGAKYYETTLHAFTGGTDGVGPWGSLVADASGALYGTTELGGAPRCGCGTVFKLTPSGSTYVESVIYAFDGLLHPPNIYNWSGTFPFGGLLLRDGILYGTANSGGGGQGCGRHEGCGTLFAVTPTLNGYVGRSVTMFEGRPNDGAGSTATPIADASGTIYATTAGGGYYNAGTVFKLSHGQVHDTVLYTFQDAADGGYPSGGLLLGPSNALYGTTFHGGSSSCSCGTVFKVQQ